MKAITLWPEWAYAIQKLGKDGENRSWRLWDSMIGQPVAIHAGMRGVYAMPSSPRWAEIAAFYETQRRVRGEISLIGNADPIRGHIVQIVTFGEPTRSSTSRWAAGDGQWFWPIVGRITIEPVKCKGAQGLWDVPAEVMDRLRAQGVL